MMEKKTQMRDSKEKEELEAQIARDKKRYGEIERLDAEMWKISLSRDSAQHLRKEGIATKSRRLRIRFA